MAPKKVNKKPTTEDTLPDNLLDYINQGTTTTTVPSTGSTVPTTTTTVPSTTIPTTTTTTIPSPTTTVAPIVKGGKTKTGTLVDKITKDIDAAERRLLAEGKYKASEVEKIKTGTQPKKNKSIWDRALGIGSDVLTTPFKVLGTGAAYGIKAIDTIDNATAALFEGGLENAQVAIAGITKGRENAESRYKTWAEIPRNKQTGAYISKPGELRLKNPQQYVDFKFTIDQLGNGKIMDIATAKNITLEQSSKYGTVDRTKKYTKQSEIPINEYTQQPIAMVGDYKYTNEGQLRTREPINTENYILPYQFTDIIPTINNDRPAKKYERAMVNPDDVWDTMNDSKFGWGSVSAITVPGDNWASDWANKLIGFTGDIAFSPSTYVSFGTATPIKMAFGSFAKTVGKEFADEAVELAVTRITTSTGRTAVKDVYKEVAEKIAVELGEKPTSAAVKQATAGVLNNAAEIVLEETTDAFVKKVATTTAKNAEKLWSAVGPRRALGATTREALAINIKNLKQEALGDAITYAGTARGRIADRFASALTEDIIGKIATKGYAAFNEVIEDTGLTIGETLGIKGGLRFGAKGAKVALPGSWLNQAGRIPSGLRTGAMKSVSDIPGIGAVAKAGTRVGNISASKVLELVTGKSVGGLPIPEGIVFDAKTGLRTGRLSGAEAVDALKLIEEDQVYRTLKKTTNNSLKQAVRDVFKDSDYAARRDVYEILDLPNAQLDVILANTDDMVVARELETALGGSRKISLKEVALARKMVQFFDQLVQLGIDAADKLGTTSLSAAEIAAKQAKGTHRVFPQVLTDNGAAWLGRKHTGKIIVNGITYDSLDNLIDMTLQSLGHGSRLIPGQSVLNQIKEKTFWFGTRLEGDESVKELNRIFRENTGAKFDLLDTNATSALVKYSKKFADDFAFLKRLQQHANIKSKYTTPPFSRTPASGAGVPTFSGIAPPARTPLATSQPFAVAASIQEGINRIADTIYMIADGGLASAGYTDAEIAAIATRLGLEPDEFLDKIDEIRALATSRGMTPPTPITGIGVGTPRPILATNRVENYVNRYELGNIFSEKKLRESMDAWTSENYDRFITEIDGQLSDLNDQLSRTGVLPTGISVDDVNARITALQEIKEVTETMNAARLAGDDSWVAWGTLRDDLSDGYLALFSRSADEVQKAITSISPDKLKTLINLAEDTFVALDNMIIPDAVARIEIASMYKNIAKINNPKMIPVVGNLIRDINKYFKTWAVTSIGFHTRNAISNTFQLLAAGANPTNINDSIVILHRWNKFISNPDNAYVINTAGERLLADPVDVVEKFVNDPETFATTKLGRVSGGASERNKNAVRTSLLETGSVGGGEIEEAFTSSVAERTGVLGQEVKTRTGKGDILSRTSTGLGALPRFSRRVGGKIEDFSRFSLTFDGLRQGMDPLTAAARTNRFLIDYEDLSRADETLKQIIPFWMWMSRNLPLQWQEMFYNPKIYKQYQEFRRNFEDEEGNNQLLPSYLKEAGAFFVGKNMLLKPDLGIPAVDGYEMPWIRKDAKLPGTGSPSPLAGASLEAIIKSSPILTAIILGAGGVDPTTGEQLREPGGAILDADVAKGIFDLFSGPAGAYVGRPIRGIPGIGAGSDWGPLAPVQEFLNVPGAQYPSGYQRQEEPMTAQMRALLGYIGLPVSPYGEPQQVGALYEQLDRLRKAQGE